MEDGYCFSQFPSLEKKCLESRAKGGKNSARAARLKGLVPPRLVPVYDRLENALEEVLITPKGVGTRQGHPQPWLVNPPLWDWRGACP